jgi:hypothetical protein
VHDNERRWRVWRERVGEVVQSLAPPVPDGPGDGEAGPSSSSSSGGTRGDPRR